MAWDDKPTDAQLDRLYYWCKWNTPTDELRNAMKWLAENATRKQVSEEMTRVRELYNKHHLDMKTLLNSDIWDKYREEVKV